LRAQENCERNLFTLATLQDTVRALGEEAKGAQGSLKMQLGQLEALRRGQRAQSAGRAEALEAFRGELLAGLKAFRTKVDRSRQQVDQLEDQLKRALLAKDEEVMHYLMH